MGSLGTSTKDPESSSQGGGRRAQEQVKPQPQENPGPDPRGRLPEGGTSLGLGVWGRGSGNRRRVRGEAGPRRWALSGTATGAGLARDVGVSNRPPKRAGACQCPPRRPAGGSGRASCELPCLSSSAFPEQATWDRGALTLLQDVAGHRPGRGPEKPEACLLGSVGTSPGAVLFLGGLGAAETPEAWAFLTARASWGITRPQKRVG